MKKTNSKRKKGGGKSSLETVIKALARKAYKRRYQIFLGFLAMGVVLLFFGAFKMLFFLALLTALNIVVSYFAKNIPKIGTSIELIMLCTVLSGLAYGAKIGALFGFISCLLYYYGAGRFSFYVTIYAPLYAITGAIIPLFSAYSVLNIGLTAAIIYTIISSIIVIVLYSAKLYRAVLFAAVNTGFNLIIFKYAAPILLRLMR